MSDGPFTDDIIRHYVKVVQTQHGILEALEAMAKVLVEMGRASQKAVGDSPQVAVYKWTDLMRRRAMEMLLDERHAEELQQALEEDCVKCGLPKP